MTTSVMEKTVRGDAKTVVCDVALKDLVPNKGMIIVRKDPQPTETKGGIILPSSAIHEQTIATVLAVPPDCVLHVGDKVVFRRGAGVPLKFVDESDVEVLRFENCADDDVLCWKHRA